MRKVYTLALAAALAVPAMSAITVSSTRSSRQGAKYLDLNNVETATSVSKHQIRKAAANAPQFNEVQLVNTGIKIADFQSGKVTMADLERATFGEGTQHRDAPHSSWTYTNNVLNETMAGFTSGSQSNPVAVSNSGGNISCKSSSSDNLYGWGVYSLGDGLGALIGSAEFRVIDIDSGSAQQIGCWVGALENNAGLMINYIEGDNGTAFLMNSDVCSIPYDGNIYWFQSSSNAFKDTQTQQVISTKISLLFMNSNGSADTSLAFCGLFVSGKRYSGTTPTPDPTPDPDVEVGVPTNVTYNLASDHKTYSVNFTKAANSTHTELYSFVDVNATRKISSLDLLNMDFSGVNAGTSNVANPYVGAAAPDVVLDAIPGGLAHWPVLIDGALGFYFDLSVVGANSVCPWAGFETSDYDLTATGGVATLFLNHYATDGAAMDIMVVGYNKSTKKYEIIDEALLNGDVLQWDGWQETTATTDAINANTYDLKHIYFAVATTMDEEYVTAIIEAAEGTVTDWPVIIYYKNIEVTLNNIPAGSKFSYLDAERQTTGNNFPTVPCPNFDRDGYSYNFSIRGMNVSNSGISYGDWYVNPENNGNIFVVNTDGVNTINADLDAEAPVEYYNLQGVRVDNPAAGQLLIRRQGNKVEKVIL